MKNEFSKTQFGIMATQSPQESRIFMQIIKLTTENIETKSL